MRLPELLVYKSDTLGNVVRTEGEKIRCLLAISFDRISGAHNNIVYIFQPSKARMIQVFDQ